MKSHQWLVEYDIDLFIQLVGVGEYQFALLGYCILPSKNPFLPMGREEIPFFREETQP